MPYPLPEQMPDLFPRNALANATARIPQLNRTAADQITQERVAKRGDTSISAREPTWQDQVGALIAGEGVNPREAPQSVTDRNRAMLAKLLVGSTGLEGGRNSLSVAGATVDPFTDVYEGLLNKDAGQLGMGALGVAPIKIGAGAKIGSELGLPAALREFAAQGARR